MLPRAIGQGLVALHFVHPEVLSRTHELFTRHLGAVFPPEQAAVLHARLTTLLGEFSSGFVAAKQEVLLAEQEQSRRTTVTERAQAPAALAESQQRLLANQEAVALYLAQELHDTTVQQLLLIHQHLQLQAQHDQAQDDPTTAAQLCVVINQLRNFITAVRPLELQRFGLTTALREHEARLRAERNLSLPDIVYDLDETGTCLPDTHALALFRVVQEAVRNVLRHAQAQHVVVRLRLQPDELILTIEDDGKGFQLPERLDMLAHQRHFGLVGMAERITWIGGQFALTSRPVGGTRVRVRLPLAGEQYEQAKDSRPSG